MPSGRLFYTPAEPAAAEILNEPLTGREVQVLALRGRKAAPSLAAQ